MSQIIVCDRCNRNVKEVPAVKLTKNMTVDKADFTLPDYTRMDLCAECFAACIAWIKLGIQE